MRHVTPEWKAAARYVTHDQKRGCLLLQQGLIDVGLTVSKIEKEFELLFHGDKSVYAQMYVLEAEKAMVKLRYHIHHRLNGEVFYEVSGPHCFTSFGSLERILYVSSTLVQERRCAALAA